MLKREESPEHKLMLAAFEKGPMDVHDVAVELGINVKNARLHLKIAHSNKALYISSWVKSARGPWRPIYSQGPGEDVKSPPARTIARHRELCKERNRTRRADVEAWLREYRLRKIRGGGGRLVEGR